MRSRLLALLLAILLGGCAAVPPDVRGVASPVCAATARSAVADARIGLAVEEARRQYRLFGAQTIDRRGDLLRVGQHEAAWPAWQRVATFWQAVSESEPPTLRTSVGRLPRAEVFALLADGASAPGPAELAMHEALLRAAIVDTPWSAAFISYLMKTAGFAPAEFAFSDRHADYVRAALETTAAEAAGREAAHAFRACDAATTPPRAGDLLCATRAATASTTRFDALPAAMAARPPEPGFPMHCDLVVRADPGGDGSLEVIGGNVVNSVTLSRMTLDGRGLLSDDYFIAAGPRRDCARGGPPCREHLSRRPWLVLLQFRR